MDFMKIALIGTHRNGKTTIAHDLVAGLKKQGVNADFLGEVVKACPLPINESTTKDSQEWTIFIQHIKEIEMKQKCSILVCDRSVLDCYIYYIRKFQENKILEEFVRDKTKAYSLLIKIPIRQKFLKEDGIKSINKEFKREIDELFDKTLKRMEIQFYNHENINKTLNLILGKIKENKNGRTTI